MMLRAMGLVGVTALIVTAHSVAALAQEVGRLELQHDMAARAMNWTDIDNESAYRVSGDIAYLHFPACGSTERAVSEHVVVEEALPANTTVFRFPPPQDGRADAIKDMELRVEALDASGSVIAMNGFAFTADKFCTPEEIAAGLAAAGTGPQGGSAGALLVGIVALGVLGITCLSGGLLMLRRKA